MVSAVVRQPGAPGRQIEFTVDQWHPSGVHCIGVNLHLPCCFFFCASPLYYHLLSQAKRPPTCPKGCHHCCITSTSWALEDYFRPTR